MALFSKKDDPELVEARRQLDAMRAHIGQLQLWVQQLRGAEVAGQEQQLRGLREAVAAAADEQKSALEETARIRAELDELSAGVVETRERVILQEVGIYEYSHPLEDALAYKDELKKLQAEIKAAARGDAVSCQVDWSVNGSVREGQKMGRDIAKLMLRAYNTAADNCVRSVKPATRDSVKTRLTKERDQIAKLGAALHIEIDGAYHRLRLREIDLTADYLMRVEVEKEEQRAERERLREEAKVAKELARERARLEKERAHYVAAAQKLRDGDGDPASVAAVEAKLIELNAAVDSVEARAANIRAGYVYVISNVGAFGRDVVKIGLTRRLEPMDRIRELGDASVPFRFDVHALFFSEDAVRLENELHKKFADRRVNMVNMRREFFYATPEEVRDALVELGTDHLLEFTSEPEALEFRASNPGRRGIDVTPVSTTVSADTGEDGDLSDDGLDG